ncbi:MAG: hypothetical protein WC792_01335 [Candidatus Micrarchaeia archaeon]|jgi:hypothetical protein
MRWDFALLLVAGILAFALNITWLCIVIAVVFAILLFAQSSPSTQDSSEREGASGPEGPDGRQVVVVQQPQSGPGFMDYFTALQMNQAVEESDELKRHKELVKELKAERKELKKIVKELAPKADKK